MAALHAKANATALLWRLVDENPQTQQAMAMAGPMSDLISLLKGGTPAARKFALWSLSLSINESNQKTLLDEEAAQPIVACRGSQLAHPTLHLICAPLLTVGDGALVPVRLRVAATGGIALVARGADSSAGGRGDYAPRQ